MTNDEFDSWGEKPSHEPLEVDSDNVLPLDVDGVSDSIGVPDKPVPVLSDDDPVPVGDVADGVSELMVDPQPAVDNVPDEVPASTVDVEGELQMSDVPEATVQRMSQLLRKRRRMSITQPQAYTLLKTDEKLFWEVYNMRTWH